MISRIWHGWTAHDSADAYESLLQHEIFAGIEAREIAGYRGIHLLRRELEVETEFVTIMWFDSRDVPTSVRSIRRRIWSSRTACRLSGHPGF